MQLLPRSWGRVAFPMEEATPASRPCRRTSSSTTDRQRQRPPGPLREGRLGCLDLLRRQCAPAARDHRTPLLVERWAAVELNPARQDIRHSSDQLLLVYLRMNPDRP